MQSVCDELREVGNGLIPGISRSDILDKALPLPPLPEQRRIVERIESLFAKLDEAKEKAQAVVDGFESRKAAILHKAFSGELTNADSVNIVPLQSITELIRIGPFGSALHKEDYVGDGVPIINPKHIQNQHIIPQETVSMVKAEELSSYRVKTNDIILGRRGEMGRTAPISQTEDGWLCGTGSMIIRLKTGFSGFFYSQIIASNAIVQYLEENAVGSTLKNLNERIVSNIPIPLFSPEQQQRIVRILDSLLQKEQQAHDAALAVLDRIDEMKKAILAKAFRGGLGTNVAEEEAVEIAEI